MNKSSKTLLISVLGNISSILLKLIGGIIGKSKTLLADSIHSCSDLGTDFFLIIGTFFSNKPADEDHPYGHGKIENIFSLAIGFIIIFVGIIVLKNTLLTDSMKPQIWVCIISIITIIIKYIMSKYLMKKGKEYSSSILISSSKESKMDILSNTFVLLVILLSLLQEKIKILKYIDTIGGVVVSLFIVYTGINIIEEEVNNLIGKKESNDLLENSIKKIINNETLEVTNINLIKFGNKYLSIIEILTNKNMSLKNSNDIRCNLEQKILSLEQIIDSKIIIIPKEN